MTVTSATPEPPRASAWPPASLLAPGTLVRETWLVLGLSLGASALWSLITLADKLTKQVALNRQTTTMNSSVTPDRPWLDLAYQLLPIVLGVVPALIAVHLLRRDDPAAARAIGIDARHPGADLGHAIALTALIGIPGLVLYLGARAAGLNTIVAPANLAEHWWTVPVLILAAAQNAILEEVVMIGYLLTRWQQAGWSTATAIGLSALIRGTYHLYQGFGGFVSNAIMGVIFGLYFTRTRRVLPLIVVHTLLDIVAFVGYALLRTRLDWLR